MSQSGEHTWDLHLEYHRCDACGKIFDDRKESTLSHGHYEKTVECPFCKKQQTLTKEKSSKFAPLFGKEEPPEIYWS